MPATYEPIATTTLGSASPSVTFSSISGSYTDLVAVFIGTMAAEEALLMEFNADTSAIYSLTNLVGNGSTATSGRATGQTRTSLVSTGTGKTSQFQTIVQIMNYSNTTTFKTSLFRTANSTQETTAGVALYRSTSAVTSIKFYGNSSSNISAGSTFTLYGIKAA
jgi:hypothetical protein